MIDAVLGMNPKKCAFFHLCSIKNIGIVDQTSEPDILMADIHRPDIVFSTQERSGLLMREFLWHEVSLSRDVSSGEAGPLR